MARPCECERERPRSRRLSWAPPPKSSSRHAKDVLINCASDDPRKEAPRSCEVRVIGVPMLRAEKESFLATGRSEIQTEKRGKREGKERMSGIDAQAGD